MVAWASAAGCVVDPCNNGGAGGRCEGPSQSGLRDDRERGIFKAAANTSGVAHERPRLEMSMQDLPPREAMDFDVVIVGAGPAGLAAAIRLKQLAVVAGRELSVVVLEKGSEVGAHILSGAVIDPIGLTRLIPDWKAKGAPVETPV